MTPAPTHTPYGSWTSPITAERITRSAVGLGQTALDGDDLYWTELRPQESGRTTVLRWRAGTVTDLLPPEFSARTRVHEYGGGAFTVADGVVYFANDADQRWYRLDADGEARAITAAAPRRYADAVVDRRRGRLLCVCEDHGARSADAPVNTIVALDAHGREPPRVLATGRDFYAAPRLSPDGGRLVWLAWDHPNMPWDGTELWSAELGSDGLPLKARCIAGGREESIVQPVFAPDGTLYFVSDRSNWWNLYRVRAGQVEAVAPRTAEFATPAWIFGQSTYAFDSAQRLVCAFASDGVWRLALLDTASGALEEFAIPFTDLSQIVAGGGRAMFLAAAPTAAQAVVRLNLESRRHEILRHSDPDVPDPGYLSPPQALTYPTAAGESAHAWFYPPANRDFQAPADSRPPLLVLSHGGPTAAASVALNLKLQFWTSRGFAVLDVNYRGSTGYGRAYRRRLDGQWGIADVEDCIAGARHLVARGWVDESRLAIRGGSAGGYTTLCALTFHDVFHAGAVYYGVSDLEALARDTHKFEARYLDRLIGPYPAERERYRARSPIHHVQRLSCPVIFFQGLEDKVVPPDQTQKMVDALRARRIPAAYVPFAGEQHGFRRAENIRHALEAELHFYARQFGFTPADPMTPAAADR